MTFENNVSYIKKRKKTSYMQLKCWSYFQTTKVYHCLLLCSIYFSFTLLFPVHLSRKLLMALYIVSNRRVSTIFITCPNPTVKSPFTLLLTARKSSALAYFLYHERSHKNTSLRLHLSRYPHFSYT